MVSYTNYQDILFSHNFVGGAGRTIIPNLLSDDRARVQKDGNNVYQFHYMILSSLSVTSR